MPAIKLSTQPSGLSPKKGQVVVIGLKDADKKVQLISHRSDSQALDGLDLKSLGCSGAFEKLTLLPGLDGQVFALIGTGTEELDEDSLRELAGTASRSLQQFDTIIFDLPSDDAQDAVNLLEGALLGLYRYFGPREDSAKLKKASAQVSRIVVITEHDVPKAAIHRSEVLADATNHIRDLVNTPPNHLYPASFAEKVKESLAESNLDVEVLDEKQLKKQGFGGLVAVGQGSNHPPRLVKITYRPKKASKHLALVGKGITFDTGGISIKPSASMVGMKYDMAGAATCYQAIVAIAALKLPIRVSAYLCLAENMPSGSALKPNDVITMRNGKTVEVLNTDAEGRLVLADGLALAVEEEADLIVDIATLTGAARVALGNRYTAVMGSAEAVSTLEAAAFDAGELIWHMPLPVELRSALDSDVADLANAKIGSTAGGMLLAGLFLKEFVSSKETRSSVSWAHLDIAGTANNDSGPYGYVPKGATGVMLRTLVSVAEGLSHQATPKIQ